MPRRKRVFEQAGSPRSPLRQRPRRPPHQQGDERRQALPRATHRLCRDRPRQRRHRHRRSARSHHPRRGKLQAARRGEIPPRRWRHLSGAARGRSGPFRVARHALDRQLRPQPQGHPDARRPRQRDQGRRQQPGQPPSASATTFTRWPRPTAPSPTSASNHRSALRTIPVRESQQSRPPIRARAHPQYRDRRAH